jgi:hypothetical protein
VAEFKPDDSNFELGSWSKMCDGSAKGNGAKADNRRWHESMLNRNLGAPEIWEALSRFQPRSN